MVDIIGDMKKIAAGLPYVAAIVAVVAVLFYFAFYHTTASILGFAVGSLLAMSYIIGEERLR